jgi:hypothetical protein
MDPYIFRNVVFNYTGYPVVGVNTNYRGRPVVGVGYL